MPASERSELAGAEELAERSLRREDGRTADTAELGGRDLKVRTAAVESTVG